MQGTDLRERPTRRYIYIHLSRYCVWLQTVITLISKRYGPYCNCLLITISDTIILAYDVKEFTYILEHLETCFKLL